jgi:hypothetical protein
MKFLWFGVMGDRGGGAGGGGLRRRGTGGGRLFCEALVARRLPGASRLRSHSKRKMVAGWRASRKANRTTRIEPGGEYNPRKPD